MVKTNATMMMMKEAPSPGMSKSLNVDANQTKVTEDGWVLVSSPSASAINSEQQVQVTDTDAKKQSTEAMDIEADEAKTTTTTTVVVIEKTPEEIARENLKKAEKDLKESIQDLEKKEQMIHAEMEADEEQKKHDAYLRGLARDLLSLEPATDAVTDCVIDLIADVQEMYYDEKNPWDPREKEELNYDKIDEVNFSMDIESDGGDTNNNEADNDNDNNGLTKVVSKNAIPVDNHPTYYTEHFQKIFNEFAYCNVNILHYHLMMVHLESHLKLLMEGQIYIV